MKTVTITGMTIQFDIPGSGDSQTEIQDALELINLALQLQPYETGAQIIYKKLDNKKIKIEEKSYEREQQEFQAFTVDHM